MKLIKIWSLCICTLIFTPSHTMFIPAATVAATKAAGIAYGGATMVISNAAPTFVTIGASAAKASVVITKAAPVVTTVAKAAWLPSFSTIASTVGSAALGICAVLIGTKTVISQQTPPKKKSADKHRTPTTEISLLHVPSHLPTLPQLLPPVLFPGTDFDHPVEPIDETVNSDMIMELPSGFPPIPVEFPGLTIPGVDEILLPAFIPPQLVGWYILFKSEYLDRYLNTATCGQHEELCTRNLEWILNQLANESSDKEDDHTKFVQNTKKIASNYSALIHDSQERSPVLNRIVKHLQVIPYQGLSRAHQPRPEGSYLIHKLPIERLFEQKDSANLTQIKETLEQFKFPHKIVYPQTRKAINRTLKRINQMLTTLEAEKQQAANELQKLVTGRTDLVEAQKRGNIEQLKAHLETLQQSKHLCTTDMERAQHETATQHLQERIKGPITQALQQISQAPTPTAAHEAYRRATQIENKRTTGTYKNGGKIKQGDPRHTDYFGFNVLDTAKQLRDARIKELETPSTTSNTITRYVPHYAASIQKDIKNQTALIKGFFNRITNLKEVAQDNIHFWSNIIEIYSNLITVKRKINWNSQELSLVKPRLGPHSKFYKLLTSVFTKDTFKKISTALEKMSVEDLHYKAGEILADFIIVSITQSGIAATARLLNTEAKLVQSIAQKATHLTTAEEIIATTAEGVPLKITQAAEEMTLLQEVSQAIRETTGNTLNSNIESHILKHKNALDLFDKKISELTKTAKPGKVGKLLEKAHAHKLPTLELETKTFYENMRKSVLDIEKITQNTGIDKNIITRIKNHLFNEEHILRNSINKFYPDEDIAAAWHRLINDNYVLSDLKLLQHEYAESLIMNGLEIPYDDVHPIINAIYNWEKSL